MLALVILNGTPDIPPTSTPTSTWRSCPHRRAMPRASPALPTPQPGAPHPSLPPRSPPNGGQRRSLCSSRSILPGYPRTRGWPVGGCQGSEQCRARAGSPDTYLQALEAPAAATYHHVSLHFSGLKHCLFLHFFALCVRACAALRELLNPAAGAL